MGTQLFDYNMTAPPNPVDDPCLSSFDDRYILVCGGKTSTDVWLNTCDILDTSNGNWSPGEFFTSPFFLSVCEEY